MEGRAAQACAACKRGKRKCDKVLPTCSLCVRLRKDCDYEASESNLTPEAFISLAQKVAQLEASLKSANSQRLHGGFNGPWSSDSSQQGQRRENGDTGTPDLISFRLPPPTFPSIYFLDSNLFQTEHHPFQKPHVKVPQEVVAALGSSEQLNAIVDAHFNDTHRWLPIISRTRLLAVFEHVGSELGADVALLFLAMRMIQTKPGDLNGMHGHLYQLTKSFIWYTESQNAYSLQLLQAAVLLAAFELGNAIYPAAFLTIGFCARLAVAMGIHDKDAPQILPKPGLWTEQEERRRVWWSIIVLDRCVSIGKRGHPLATQVGVQAILPVDDDAWARGQATAAQPLAITANTQIEAAPFARLCQASHLLGRVIEHCNDNKMPEDFRYEEAASLNQAVSSFSCSASNEIHGQGLYGMDYCPSMAVALSALFQLYDRYSCPDSVPGGASEKYNAMQEIAIRGLEVATDKVYSFAKLLRESIDIYGMDGISPFVLDAFYECAANYTWYVREQGDDLKRSKCTELRHLLQRLDQRWKAAGEYLRIVDAFEHIGLQRDSR